MTDKDIYIKRVQFIYKAAKLNLEFYFASGRMRLELNSIYNNHLTGSSLWNLEFRMFLQCCCQKYVLTTITDTQESN